MSTPTSHHHSAVPRAVLLALLGIVVILIAFGTAACQSLAGGPVLSATEYRERVAETEAAGERALEDLEPLPTTTSDGALEEGSSSCVDDFGFDDTGVTRSEPTYEWALDFPDRDAYLTAVENLRRTWIERGLNVQRVKADQDSGLPGVTAIDDGIQLTLAPDWYSDEPVLRTNGGCIRHEYSFEDKEISSAY
ncbi:hypothetical protein ACWDV7_36545 [Streptomyces sp. NPDC003362]